MKYDFPHGKVVSILMISWLKFIKEINQDRIIKFGQNVFNIQNGSVDDVIREIAKVFDLLENPNNLEQMGVNLEDIDSIVENAMLGKKLGKYKLLSKSDIKKIILWSYYGI